MTFLLSPLGRMLGTVLIAALAWFSWLGHHDQKVTSRVIAKIEKGNSENVEKANAARRTADKLPDSGLRDRYFRD